MSSSRLIAAAAAAALAAGCPPTTDRCVQDVDCGGAVCANTGECVAAHTVHRVQVRWTVGGAAADAFRCAPIAELSLTVHEEDTGDESTYAPVPCEVGQFTFAKLPRRFDRLRLRALATGEVHWAWIDDADDVRISFDFETGDRFVPDAAPGP
jgi:hypothetical protein